MSDIEAIKDQLDRFRADFQRLRREIAKVIVGQDDIVEGTLTALIAGGHVLLEGVPGLGKTLLVKTLSRVLHLPFSRIQFVPLVQQIAQAKIIEDTTKCSLQHLRSWDHLH